MLALFFSLLSCKKIKVDNQLGDIQIEANDEIKIAYVEKRKLSKDEILKFMRIFSGDFSELYSYYELNKEELIEISSIIDKSPGMVFAESKESLHLRMQQAKDICSNVRITIDDFVSGNVQQVYVKQEMSCAAYAFTVDGNFFTFFRDMDMAVLGESLCKDYIHTADESSQVYSSWLMPQASIISYDEALEEAESYLSSMGINLSLYFSEPCTVLSYGIVKSNGWKFVFTKELWGLQSQFEDGQWSYANPKKLPVVGAPWDQEMCVITIDEKGLCQLWWQGASEELYQEETDLTPVLLKDILRNAENYILQVYGDDTNHKNDKLHIRVTNASLGIGLLATDNVYETGRYVPCWYINFDLRWDMGQSGVTEWQSEQIIFSAIDGSYVEPRIEDKTLKELRK